MQAVNAGVHRTYSMFVEILEKSPNFEDRGGECSPPLILYMEKEKAKKDVEQISTEAIEELNKLPGNNEFLEHLIRALVGRQK